MKKINAEIIKKGVSRDELRSVKGGCGGGNGYYKCCWTGTSNCSICVYSYSGAPCVSGASLVGC